MLLNLFQLRSWKFILQPYLNELLCFISILILCSSSHVSSCNPQIKKKLIVFSNNLPTDFQSIPHTKYTTYHTNQRMSIFLCLTKYFFIWICAPCTTQRPNRSFYSFHPVISQAVQDRFRWDLKLWLTTDGLLNLFSFLTPRSYFGWEHVN